MTRSIIPEAATDENHSHIREFGISASVFVDPINDPFHAVPRHSRLKGLVCRSGSKTCKSRSRRLL